jgi:hypothetical protein
MIRAAKGSLSLVVSTHAERGNAVPNPLSFYTLVKQDADSQGKIKSILDAIPAIRDALNRSQIVHYARFVAVPNVPNDVKSGIRAMMVITEFDGTMESYIKFFFDDPKINQAFTLLGEISVKPPQLPLELNDFTNWVVTNNLSGQPDSLWSAYEQTVKQIKSKFSA